MIKIWSKKKTFDFKQDFKTRTNELQNLKRVTFLIYIYFFNFFSFYILFNKFLYYLKETLSSLKYTTPQRGLNIITVKQKYQFKIRRILDDRISRMRIRIIWLFPRAWRTVPESSVLLTLGTRKGRVLWRNKRHYKVFYFLSRRRKGDESRAVYRTVIRIWIFPFLCWLFQPIEPSCSWVDFTFLSSIIPRNW